MRFSRSSLNILFLLPGFCFFLFPLAAPAALVVQAGKNFSGARYGTDSDSEPADCNGAVGPSHFVELINGRYSVFNKTTGGRVQTMTDLAFWIKSGVVFSANLDVTDPRIVFDGYSQRWFAASIDFDYTTQSSNRFLLAVSATADPTGSWHGFAFLADPLNGNFADFTTLGVDASGVYVAGDTFDSIGNSLGPMLMSIPKSGLLADPPSIAGRTSFGILDYNERGFILQPAVTTGAASSGEIVLAAGDLGYDFQPHTTLMASTIKNSAIPNGATLTLAEVLTVPPYSVPINPPQPDGSDNLDDGDARISACVRRVGDVLYAVQGVEIDDRAAIRWYQIDAVNQVLRQTGTITDRKLHLFYPSIAANAAGTVVIAFNGCSSNSFVSCYAVAGDTVDGTLRLGDPILLKAGAASYQRPDPATGTSRWGDYSATCVDPSDPNRFWTIQMYPASKTVWASEISELITSPLRLTVSLAGTNVSVSWPAAATGFELQYRATWSGGWAAVSQSTVMINNQTVVLLPASGSGGFFRLAKP